jgi:hypothetical protein
VWGSEFTTKAATLQGGGFASFIVVLRPLLAAALVERRRYLVMVPRPFPAAPLVVRRRYLAVVPRPMPAAPRMYLIVVYRPLPAAPLVVRFSAFYLHGRGTRADTCGRSFAVLSTQVSAVGLRLRHISRSAGDLISALKLRVLGDLFFFFAEAG